MSFERPWLLLVAAALAVAYVPGYRALARTLRGPRKTLVAVLQGALFAAVALALAGPTLPRWRDRVAVVVLVDRSRSSELVPQVDARVRALLEQAWRGMHANDAAGVVVFAQRPETATPVAPRGREPPAVPPSPNERDRTDIAAALLHALGDVPADTAARIALVSDGDETDGDARAAALVAAAAGVPVDVVPLERPPRADVAAVRLRVPERTERGEAVDLALVTRATQPSRVRVELLRDDVSVGHVERTVGAGEDVIDLRDAPPSPGLHRYEARLVPLSPADDAVAGDEIAAGYVRVAGGARAVVVDGHPGGNGAALLVDALSAAGLQAERVPARAAPAVASDWAAYDLVVLSDVRARDLDPAALGALRDAVRELGAGLLMVGSDGSFGPGGYAGSPLAEVLPVDMELRRRRQRATVGLAVVIDRSGSMGASVPGGRTKLDLANEAAARAASLLGPLDQVALLHVDTEVTWTLPLRAADDAAAIAAAAHRASVGGGGIYTDVGLRAAYTALAPVRTTIRHVILLADGSDAEQLAGAHALTLAAARDNVTTTVVAIGTGSDVPELERLAHEGGGRFYVTEDARSLPQIFTEDTALAARSVIREEPLRAVVAHAADVLRGIDWAAAPALAGYVVTESRGRAEVLLEALDHDPLLARWQIGLGRAAVFTADVDGRFTRGWLPWPGFGTLLGQTGAWLARGVRDAGVRVAATAVAGRVRVEVDAVTAAGAWDTGLDLQARVVVPGGGAVAVPLEARGAGRYEGELRVTRAGTYLATVTSGDGAVVGATGVQAVAGVEVTAASGDRALLEAVAARSGGRVRRDLAGVFDDRRGLRRGAVPVGRECAWAALACLLACVAARRSPAPSLGPLRRWLAARAKRPAVAATHDTDGVLAVLRARRRGPRETPPHITALPLDVATPPSHDAPPTTAAAPPAPRADDTPSAPSAGLDALVARKRGRRR